jgi:ketosteroid isomerase-like protein
MTGTAIDDLHGWLTDVFASVDAMDSDRFVEFLSADAEFRFGSAPAVTGRDDIAAAVAGFFETIDGCSHEVSGAWTGPDAVVCEGTVTYRRKDGSQISLPFVDVFDMDHDRIRKYKIYIDVGPLYAG